MLLEGSCHCEAVRFRVNSPSPYPYLACYCTICRKTAGGGGYAINLGALSETLEVEGAENVSVYQAHAKGVEDTSRTSVNPAQWNFCRVCGSSLWVYSPRWPELVHPFASAVDTPLPEPPEKVRMMLNYAAPWCEIPENGNERHFPEFPDESLEEWHRRHGLYGES
ncbi:MAG: hypothetical protein AVDCRST_MAG78-3649 [uncultured Rubrobacteraceae bacterium]|uniref:CENP-V/GFA domain-containing protein n=1 Tax=uncultured Rubrobacteraceae bacterium TaxID=349277 RepID=A0A6J4QS76_9ACTN|nr:MAG: hypothetical protein AVDCRST_MAG78-3649 [uncultured Rubrobacteraceae bacterium]